MTVQRRGSPWSRQSRSDAFAKSGGIRMTSIFALKGMIIFEMDSSNHVLGVDSAADRSDRACVAG